MEETIIVIIGTSLCHEYNPNVVFFYVRRKKRTKSPKWGQGGLGDLDNAVNKIFFLH